MSWFGDDDDVVCGVDDEVTAYCGDDTECDWFANEFGGHSSVDVVPDITEHPMVACTESAHVVVLGVRFVLCK